MHIAERASSIDLITIPRAVLSIAVGVMHTVERAMVGSARVRTARGNAWEAICADRERAQQRDEIRRVVAGLTATRTGAAGRPVSPSAPGRAAL
jgi:hypothetical protein